MPGISLLRPQYNSLGTVATRLAGGARQVAHEQDLAAVSALGDTRAGGGQEEVIVQEVTPFPYEQPQDQDGKRQPPRDQAAAPAKPAAPRETVAGEFTVDPHLPPPERMAPPGLLVAAPLAMPERLRAAEQAYGYSREVLRGGVGKPGGNLNAAS